jgi:hypothetical protein
MNLEDLHEIFTKTTTWDLKTRNADGHTCIDYLIHLDDEECCAVIEVMCKNGIIPNQLLLDGLENVLIQYFVLTKKQIAIMLKYGIPLNLINTCIGIAVFEDSDIIL